MEKYHLQNKAERELKDEAEIKSVLTKGKFTVISMCRNNEPYIVSLSYGYDIKNNSLYFHCSQKGLKLDFINENPKVCATVIEDGGYVINECAHNYRTVVFWGKMGIVTDPEDRKHGMKVLLSHLESNQQVVQEKLQKMEAGNSGMEILKLEIEQIHGKAGK